MACWDCFFFSLFFFFFFPFDSFFLSSFFFLQLPTASDTPSVLPSSGATRYSIIYSAITFSKMFWSILSELINELPRCRRVGILFSKVVQDIDPFRPLPKKRENIGRMESSWLDGVSATFGVPFAPWGGRLTFVSLVLLWLRSYCWRLWSNVKVRFTLSGDCSLVDAFTVDTILMRPVRIHDVQIEKLPEQNVEGSMVWEWTKYEWWVRRWLTLNLSFNRYDINTDFFCHQQCEHVKEKKKDHAAH